MLKKTKIVCTIGPASRDADTMREMLEAGMNVARLNFSHGTHEEHRKTIETFRRVRDEQDRPAAILLDTKGPEIRLGDFENGSEILEEGDEFTLTSEECPGTKERVSTTYKALPSQVSLGTSILIDDGRVRLRVAGTTEDEVRCIVVNGGKVSNRKGVNIPNQSLDLESASRSPSTTGAALLQTSTSKSTTALIRARPNTCTRSTANSRRSHRTTSATTCVPWPANSQGGSTR